MTAPILRTRDLRVEFAHSTLPAVDGADLTVTRGEVVALVGESGSGKTMIARAVLGLLPPGASATGSVLLDGTEVLDAEEHELDQMRGLRAAMVFQEPQTALNPVRTIGWQLTEALRAHRRVGRRAARERAVELLEMVGIPEPARRVRYYPHQLSGGQRQRVVIALALSGEPSLLIADEPTTALDTLVQTEILELLRELRGRTGAAILLITHNLGVVADLADRVVVLRSGRVVEQREVTALFDRPATDYARRLIDSVPRLGASVSALPSDSGPDRGNGPDPAALDLRSVSVVYPGRAGRAPYQALQDVSLAVAPGEVVGLVGESGSGKTTLGRVALGLVRPSAGQVLLEGRDLSLLRGSHLRNARRGMALVHQDPTASLDPRFTVEESIVEPLRIHGVPESEGRRRVAWLLRQVRLPGNYAVRRSSELSGGQRQRVALARALALEPRLVVADEPTSALDVSVQAEVLDLFRSLQAELKFSCLFVSHDLAVVETIADRVAVLRSGELIELGTPTSVFTEPARDYTRRLLAAVPVPDPVVQRERRLAYSSLDPVRQGGPGVLPRQVG